MRHIVLTTALAFIAGLFFAGQGLGTGEYEHGKAAGSGSAMMEETHQSEMAAHSLDNEQVRELQKILTDRGFEAGPVDGIIGPRTTQALRNFQESEGLAVSGNPDENTLKALAPDAETQEFFGLSPEFGEKGMEEKGMEETGTEKMRGTSEGTKMKESY